MISGRFFGTTTGGRAARAAQFRAFPGSRLILRRCFRFVVEFVCSSPNCFVSVSIARTPFGFELSRNVRGTCFATGARSMNDDDPTTHLMKPIDKR